MAVLTSCMQVKVMSSCNIVSLCSQGGGEDQVFTRGGEIFLGNPLWGEYVLFLRIIILSPGENFQGEVLSCDTGSIVCDARCSRVAGSQF